MHLTALLLEEFRCYRHLALEIPARGLVITGANGSGKSTILEAVAFLATTRSPRAGLDREMIRWESGADLASAPYTRVHGEVATVDGAVVARHRAATRPGDRRGRADDPQACQSERHCAAGGGCGRQSARRRLRADRPRTDHRPAEHAPPLPRHHALAGGSQATSAPSPRTPRRSRSGTRSSNASPPRAAAPNDPEVLAELTYWDETIIRSGAYVHARRQTTLARLSAHAEEAFLALTEGGRPLAVAYKPSIPTGPDGCEPQRHRERSRRATSRRRCTNGAWRSIAAPSRSSGRTATT